MEYFCDFHRLPEEHRCESFIEITNRQRDKWKNIREFYEHEKEDEVRRIINENTISKEEEQESEMNIPFLFKLIGLVGFVALAMYVLTKVLA
jgi:hypothetical protein